MNFSIDSLSGKNFPIMFDKTSSFSISLLLPILVLHMGQFLWARALLRCLLSWVFWHDLQNRCKHFLIIMGSLITSVQIWHWNCSLIRSKSQTEVYFYFSETISLSSAKSARSSGFLLEKYLFGTSFSALNYFSFYLFYRT